MVKQQKCPRKTCSFCVYSIKSIQTQPPDRPFHNSAALSRDVPDLHKIRRSPDLEALKFWNGRSGKQQASKKTNWRQFASIHPVSIYALFAAAAQPRTPTEQQPREGISLFSGLGIFRRPRRSLLLLEQPASGRQGRRCRSRLLRQTEAGRRLVNKCNIGVDRRGRRRRRGRGKKGGCGGVA